MGNSPLQAPVKIEKTNSRKNEGDVEFENGNFRAAIKLYTEKFSTNSKDIYFLSRRAECKIALGEYAPALEDALQIVAVNKHYRRGYILAVKCYVGLKNIESAEELISSLQSIQYVVPSALHEEFIEFYRIKCRKNELHDFIVAAFVRRDYRSCIEYINQVLSEIGENNNLKLLKAKCYLELKLSDMAKSILDHILTIDATHFEANFLLAKYEYSQGEVSECIKLLDGLLKTKAHNIDGVKALRTKASKLLSAMERGLELYSKRKYRPAFAEYSAALELIEQQDEKILAVILYNQGSIAMRCRAFGCAIRHFTEALKLNQNCKELKLKLYERRAICFKELKLYVDCQYDLENAIKIQCSKVTQHMMKVVRKKREKLKYQHQVSIFMNEENLS